MNQSHLDWAMNHDWYLDHFIGKDGQLFIVVEENLFDTVTGNWMRDSLAFDKFTELRNWAGY